jgi:predicted DsbA family dithiol-disulfide isomerase
MKWAEIWGRIAPARIVIYADFIDAFCYIGFHNARLVSDAEGIPLEWRGFELNPGTPSEGLALESAANSDLRPGMWSSVLDFAKKSGLTLTEPSRVPNTRLAHLWVRTIQKQDVKNSLIDRIYQAYLSDKKEIGEVGVLREIADEFNLPAEPIVQLAAQQDASPMERCRKEAVDYGFPGMPGFIFRGKTYFGALSEDAWKKIIERKTKCSTR